MSLTHAWFGLQIQLFKAQILGKRQPGCPSFCSRLGANAGIFELWTPIIAFHWYTSTTNVEKQLRRHSSFDPKILAWEMIMMSFFLLEFQHILAPRNEELYGWVLKASQFYVHSPTVYNCSCGWHSICGKKGTPSIYRIGWEGWVIIGRAPAPHWLNCYYCYHYYYYCSSSSLTVWCEVWRANLRQVRRWWFGQHEEEFPAGFHKSLRCPALPENTCSQSVSVSYHELYNGDACLKFALQEND